MNKASVTLLRGMRVLRFIGMDVPYFRSRNGGQLTLESWVEVN